MPDLPEEAVQAALAPMAEHPTRWQYVSKDDVREILEAAAPILAAQVRRETAEQIAEAITGSICGPAEACANRACSDCARYMQAQEDAIIARQIGGDHAS